MLKMKDRLYYKDTYQTDLDTTVLSCEPKGKKYLVTLEESIFYPEGGGQSSDIGIIDNARVIDVHEREGKIIHTVDSPVEVGKKVHISIDWEHRFTDMQHHSAEHIISGLILKHYGFNNVGFHMGSNLVTLDYSGELKEDDILKIEMLANEAVFKNIPTIVTYPTPEELEAMEFWRKKDIKGDVRIVTVADCDTCACCGTHVSSSGEIGCIKLLSAQKYKGGTRLTMVCGKRALADYSLKDTTLAKIGKLLSMKLEQCPDGVEKLIKQISEQKQIITSLREESVKRIAESVEDTDGFVMLWQENYAPDELRMLAYAVVAKVSGGCCALCGSDEDGYKYAIASNNINLREKSKEINTVLSGRGGGTPQIIQGSFSATKQKIEEYFSNIK